MSQKDEQWYILTLTQLEKLVDQGTCLGATAELEHYRTLKAEGKTAVIYYKQERGIKVLNEDDPEQYRRSLSIGRKAKWFEG